MVISSNVKPPGKFESTRAVGAYQYSLHALLGRDRATNRLGSCPAREENTQEQEQTIDR
jgi:hypothetical protein